MTTPGAKAVPMAPEDYDDVLNAMVEAAKNGARLLTEQAEDLGEHVAAVGPYGVAVALLLTGLAEHVGRVPVARDCLSLGIDVLPAIWPTEG